MNVVLPSPEAPVWVAAAVVFWFIFGLVIQVVFFFSKPKKIRSLKGNSKCTYLQP